MNMKKRVILIMVFVAIFVSLFVFARAQSRKTGDVEKIVTGRFQLFQGHYTINAKGGPFKDDGIFKIDTDTGRAWIYREGQSVDGVLYKKWESIQD